jgi:hypothetical protein
MYFDALFKLGAITLSGGLLATIYFYVVCRDASSPRQGPSFVRYFAVAILFGIGGYIVGTAIGIYFACSSPPTAANLCGVYMVRWALGRCWRALRSFCMACHGSCRAVHRHLLTPPRQRPLAGAAGPNILLSGLLPGSPALVLLSLARLPCSTAKAAALRRRW